MTGKPYAEAVLEGVRVVATLAADLQQQAEARMPTPRMAAGCLVLAAARTLRTIPAGPARDEALEAMVAGLRTSSQDAEP